MTVSLPSVADLHRMLNYDAVTGQFTWKERPEDMFRAGRWGTRRETALSWNRQFAGTDALNSVSTEGYRVGSIFRRQMKAHRVAWAMHHGDWPVSQIDHINGDRCDNRIENLRVVDPVGNGRNRSVSANSQTGTVGVYRRYGRWHAHIYVRGRHINLGAFHSLDEATAVRKEAERRIGFHPNHGRQTNEART